MSRVPLVLVPGLAADGRLWQPVLDELGELVDPIVAPCSGDTIAAMADEILETAPDRFYLAGTSMGGYVAIDAALRGTDRLAGLMLLNTSGRSASPEQLDRAGGQLDDVGNGLFDAVVDKLSGAIAGGKPEVAALAATMMRDTGPEGYVRQQRAVMARGDRRAELSRISAPTLVIGGDDDRATPPSLSSELARLIPTTELHIFAACGHLSTVEATSEVASTMRQWINRQEAAHTQ